MAAIISAVNQKKALTVFMQISAQPLFTISRQSIINQVIEVCGGKNIFADIFALHHK